MLYTGSPNPIVVTYLMDVHCIGDATQPSHPLTSSFPSALNLSQHQGLSDSEILALRYELKTTLDPLFVHLHFVFKTNTSFTTMET